MNVLKNWLFLFPISVFVLLTFSCSGVKSSDAEKLISGQTRVQNLIEKDIAWLVGKRINSVDSILSDDISHEKVLFLFNYHDCGTCVKTGFTIVNSIDKKKGKEYVKVIGSMISDLASVQRFNEYHGFIYIDTKDLIRRELKYVPTPMLLRLDVDNRIVKALIPTTGIDNQAVKVFVESCVK